MTAKIKWLTRYDDEGRGRWIHCTPLIGANGQIGVWMVIVVDDEQEKEPSRRWKQAPPIERQVGSLRGAQQHSKEYWKASIRTKDYAVSEGSRRSGSLCSL